MNFLEGFWERKSGPRNWVPGFRATKLSFQLLWKTIEENQSSADVVAINPLSRRLEISPAQRRRTAIHQQNLRGFCRAEFKGVAASPLDFCPYKRSNQRR